MPRPLHAVAAAQTAAEPDRNLGPVLEFMRTLWSLDHALQSASKRMESRVGVTGPQRLVIRIVGRNPGISAGAVSDILHLHPSTLTGVLKRLETRGMVERRADPADARRALLHLTARGREIDDVRAGTVEIAVRRALGRLPPRTVTAARTLAEALVSELERLD
ncbi:MarR family winged helix-turn-helix transcriptional regulator [Anaeromyxobacter oryzae]|nr:MarR family transcriptional regulator [Anaeromyxobacter oryzae]